MYPLTPWVKRLLIANVVMFFVSATSPGLANELAFWPFVPYGNWAGWPGLLVRPWTAFTYTFLHAGMGHLFFNMLGLFFFGPRLEARLGSNDFLKLYFLAGLGGAVFSFAFGPGNPVIGASGAVYGVLLGFALIWPRERIYIWGILPVEAWLLASLLIGASLWSGLTGSGGNIAHFAHLGGLAFGFGYLKLREWRKGSAKRDFKRKLDGGSGRAAGGLGGDRSLLKRWESIETGSLHELNRDEVESLVDKARQAGVRTLTLEERQFLDRMAASRGG